MLGIIDKLVRISSSRSRSAEERESQELIRLRTQLSEGKENLEKLIKMTEGLPTFEELRGEFLDSEGSSYELRSLNGGSIDVRGIWKEPDVAVAIGRLGKDAILEAHVHDVSEWLFLVEGDVKIELDYSRFKEKRILVVDDEPTVVNMAAQYFEPEGFKVLKACDGEEGLRAIYGESLDAVLLDLRMPKISGLDLYVKARSLHPKLLVYFVTGYASSEIKSIVENSEYTELFEKGQRSLQDLVKEISYKINSRISDTVNLVRYRGLYIPARLPHKVCSKTGARLLAVTLPAEVSWPDVK